MIQFFLHVQWMLEGRMIQLSICRGTQHDHRKLGEVSFEPDEWEAFRPVLIGGMRAASYARIKIEMMDQTRQTPKH